MKSNKFKLLSIVLLLAIVGAILPCALAQTDTVSSAKNTLNTCYEAALKAEADGANITQLQDKLNTAGLLISQAEYAGSQNDFGSANNYAQQAQNTLSGFISEANSLGDTASQQQQMSFLINVVGSIVGTIAIIGGSIAVWTYLKKKNQKQLAEQRNGSSTV